MGAAFECLLVVIFRIFEAAVARAEKSEVVVGFAWHRVGIDRGFEVGFRFAEAPESVAQGCKKELAFCIVGREFDGFGDGFVGGGYVAHSHEGKAEHAVGIGVVFLKFHCASEGVDGRHRVIQLQVYHAEFAK